MQQLKGILLVEDGPRDVELTLAALEEFKLANEVVVARDVITALDYRRPQGNFKTRPEGNPVVVLLDIKMPRLSGLEVLRFIKEKQHLKLIPVGMLTSSREEPDLQES